MAKQSKTRNTTVCYNYACCINYLVKKQHMLLEQLRITNYVITVDAKQIFTP